MKTDNRNEKVRIAGFEFMLVKNKSGRWEIKFWHERGFEATVASTWNTKEDAKVYLEKYYYPEGIKENIER